jgi:dTDP-4-amino-4,6-dideoxygalactose transaminase
MQLNSICKIPFHQPSYLSEDFVYLQKNLEADAWAVESEESITFFKNYFPDSTCFFTNSCSSALELAVRALDIGPGDEVIIPGFGYVAVANAVVNNGARPVFADVRLSDANIDPISVLSAITSRTRAIIAIDYAGVPCDTDALAAICREKGIYLIEDAAQGIGSTHRGKFLGSFGHIACMSFDYMKNISCGQGGLLIVNDKTLLHRIQTAFNNGTNRQDLLEGQQQHFDWLSRGGNYQISPIASHFIWPQLRSFKEITEKRKSHWNKYRELLKGLHTSGEISLPHLPTHNGHIFYLLTSSEEERSALKAFLRERGIFSEQHYSSLAASTFGSRFADPTVSLKNADILCDRLLRLPLWNNIGEEQIETVSAAICSFYQARHKLTAIQKNDYAEG